MTNTTDFDSDLEHQVREMLQRRACDMDGMRGVPAPRQGRGSELGTAPSIPTGPGTWTGAGTSAAGRRSRAALAGACLAAAAALVFALWFAPSGRTEAITEPAVGSSAAELPDGVLDAGLAVFVGGDDPVATGEAYLADRLPDLEVAFDEKPSSIEVDAATLRWHWIKTSLDSLETSGWLHLRRADDGLWVVVAATTDGVDLRGTAIDRTGGIVSIASDRGQSIAVDLTDLPTGQPIDHETGLPVPLNEIGIPSGTLAMSDLDPNLIVPVSPVAPDTIGVRVIEVGGTTLSVTEFGLQIAPVDPVDG